MDGPPNYLTPTGYAALHAEYDRLLSVERPKTVDIVSWAAGNGDRSENGDYIYGRKRLREIDGQLNRLSKKLKNARVVDPALQADQSRVYFGATVSIADDNDEHRVVTLVGDVRRVQLPGGVKEWEILGITYPQV